MTISLYDKVDQEAVFGIIATLEVWKEYTRPIQKQRKVDRMDRLIRSGRR